MPLKRGVDAHLPAIVVSQSIIVEVLAYPCIDFLESGLAIQCGNGPITEHSVGEGWFSEVGVRSGFRLDLLRLGSRRRLFGCCSSLSFPHELGFRGLYYLWLDLDFWLWLGRRTS